MNEERDIDYEGALTGCGFVVMSALISMIAIVMFLQWVLQ